MLEECPVSRKSGECPVQPIETPINATLNPANNMPYAETLQAYTDPSVETLSTVREESTIPRADAETTWQYPSTRMFYAALQRKGKPVPPDAVESMVNVHNALNEAVWAEVVKTESVLAPQCRPQLVRFTGRPEEWSPRAWWHVRMRGGLPPFDRHDWIIDRCGCNVRYVIDYYDSHPEEGQATFNVDLRPALDTPQACLDRMRLFWYKHFSRNDPIQQ
ncbi:Cytochrome c and c1 heme-lyase [Paramicrosporidium saccamoebae]|uniref:Holocytochrome c-type synthase n=1 Tax=Paramicrosporidium saccamoebae TaxID=1246581 RepID=A0A2H9TGC9_9FUNG|nr:Cytochrome c and c1 heme-lyase [Paramicrosporidium saccamoebae]